MIFEEEEWCCVEGGAGSRNRNTEEVDDGGVTDVGFADMNRRSLHGIDGKFDGKG